jgi:hypothetical protein
MAGRPDGVRRELLVLVALVLVVDLVFIGGYYLAGLVRATGALKIGYTALWTAVTLLVVLRGLARIRAERIRRRRAAR